MNAAGPCHGRTPLWSLELKARKSKVFGFGELRLRWRFRAAGVLPMLPMDSPGFPCITWGDGFSWTRVAADGCQWLRMALRGVSSLPRAPSGASSGTAVLCGHHRAPLPPPKIHKVAAGEPSGASGGFAGIAREGSTAPAATSPTHAPHKNAEFGRLPAAPRTADCGQRNVSACKVITLVSPKACVTATAQICTLSQNGYGARCCEPNDKTRFCFRPQCSPTATAATATAATATAA